MISLEEIRQHVISTFKDVHDANYPDTLVDYPNKYAVDLDHQKEPFVVIEELDFTKTEQSSMGERDLYTPIGFMVNYYFKEGRGTAQTLKYTDMLNDKLGMKKIGPLYYSAVTPISIQTFPGWRGTMNRITVNVAD